MEKPEGIAVDDDGNFFVADYTTGFIKKYDPSYHWLLTFSEYGSLEGQTRKAEFMDIHDGLLYVPEAGNHRISVFDTSGRFQFVIGSPGIGLAQFDTPESAKFNSKGLLYVVDLNNDRVQILDKVGHLVGSFGRSGSGPGQFKSPAGIAFDKDDNVYVTEIGNNRIQIFDRAGRYLTSFGVKGTGDGQFDNAHGIIVDKSTGTIYVADTGNYRIQVFEPANEKSNRAGIAK